MSKTLRMQAGDLVINADTGQLELIEDNDKTVQDVAEMLMTPLFADVDVEFGSELDKVEQLALPRNAQKAFVGHKVAESMDRLIALQDFDSDLSGNERVDHYDVDVVSSGMLGYTFYLDVRTLNGRSLSLPPYEIDLSHTVTPANLFKTSNGS